MARIHGRGSGRPPEDPRKGPQFEYEVLETLRIGLPRSFHVAPNVLLLDEYQGRDRPKGDLKTDRDREVDFVVSGPPGLVVIEAKCWDGVSGSLSGAWWDRMRVRGGRVVQSERIKSPIGLLKTNLERVSSRVHELAPTLKGYGPAQGVLVFPKGARIQVTNGEGAPIREAGRLHVVELPELVRTIQSFRPPQRGNGQHELEATARDTAELIRLFSPAAPSDNPIVGPYTRTARLEPVMATNGVPFVRWEIRHNEMGWVREGKAYDLESLEQGDRDQFDQQVKRHAHVGASVRHPCVHAIIDSFLHGSELWVIQERVAGKRLQQLLDRGKRAELPVLSMLKQIASGLSAMHEAGYVRRELCPLSILVTDEGQRAILTDFELAKSMTGAPTVAVDRLWRENPFVAPEVIADAHHGAPSADIFSWGCVAFVLLTGTEYKRPDKSPLGVVQGERLKRLVSDCIELFPSRRPASMQVVLEALESV